MADVNPLPSLFTIGPAHRDHEVAVRCGITVFVPLFTLLLVDRIDLAIFASFGAFTAIYGRNLIHRERIDMQLRAGGMMIVVLLLAAVASRLGISESQNPWALVAATTVVAGACAAISGWWRLRPSGSLFHIFAFAAVASVPQQPPLLDSMITAVATVVFALLIGVSSRLFSRQARTRLYRPDPEPHTLEARRIVWWEAFWYVVAAGVAGSLATALGPVLGMSHNYWAMVAAVVPLVGHSTRYRVNRGLQRIIGTFLGLGVMGLVLWLRPELWQMIIIIAILQFTAEMFIARQYAIAQTAVTPLALLATLLAATGTGGSLDRGQLLYDRALETVIGAVVGMACVIYPWAWRKWVRRSADPARERI